MQCAGLQPLALKLIKCHFPTDKNEMSCSSCSDKVIVCGPKFTEVDYRALGSHLWKGFNVSWEVIEVRYDMGTLLGTGSYAHVIEVGCPAVHLSDTVGNR
jgi:hypothetical protein